MALTARDFNAIAEELNIQRQNTATKIGLQTWSNCVHSVARGLSKTNPRFDYYRFVDACNAERPKGKKPDSSGI